MDYSKYETALDMMSCVEFAKDEGILHKSWDNLFDFIHANFAPPSTMISTDDDELSACYGMLTENYKTLAEFLYEIPPHYAEFLFPVAIARHLLLLSGYISAKIIPRKLKTFNEFHKRYGKLVLQSVGVK